MKYIQIGTAALRTPDGSFLPAEPIFREVQGNASSEQNYIEEDVLFNIFASRIQTIRDEERKKRKCK